MKDKEIYEVPTLHVISLIHEDVLSLSSPVDFDKVNGDYDKENWQ